VASVGDSVDRAFGEILDALDGMRGSHALIWDAIKDLEEKMAYVYSKVD